MGQGIGRGSDLRGRRVDQHDGDHRRDPDAVLATGARAWSAAPARLGARSGGRLRASPTSSPTKATSLRVATPRIRLHGGRSCSASSSSCSPSGCGGAGRRRQRAEDAEVDGEHRRVLAAKALVLACCSRARTEDLLLTLAAAMGLAQLGLDQRRRRPADRVRRRWEPDDCCAGRLRPARGAHAKAKLDR